MKYLEEFLNYSENFAYFVIIYTFKFDKMKIVCEKTGLQWNINFGTISHSNELQDST